MHDAVWLSRVQFALTIGFHYLFPPLTIGLGLLMVIMEGAYLKTRNRIYESMAKFFTKIFALIFAMGVATGIVMEFQFGTNWSSYSRFVGDVFGPALAAEGIFAFFLESGFLAVLVFGWDRVSDRMHFFSTLMVALGSMFSALWIVVANSWQQTPDGFVIGMQTLADGSLVAKAQLESFWVAVLNHSTLTRLAHVLVGTMLSGGFLVLSVASYYYLKKRHMDFARRAIVIAMPFVLVFSILSLVTGDTEGKGAAKYQPAKLAAMEGLYQTRTHAPLHIFGIPNNEQQRVDYGLAIPGMLSFLVDWSTSTKVTGLDAFPVEDRPPVQVTFQVFHLMVALGMFMIGLSILGTILLWHGALFRQRWLLWIFVFAIIAPVLANELGWFTAEVGRQPWVVYPQYENGNYMNPIGGLRTSEGASKSVDATEVWISIGVISTIYLLLLIVWLFVLDQKIRTGPESVEELEKAAAAAAAGKGGWFETARERADHAGGSMTDVPREKDAAHDQPENAAGEAGGDAGEQDDTPDKQGGTQGDAPHEGGDAPRRQNGASGEDGNAPGGQDEAPGDHEDK